ncbi:hypothetical protein QAD02_010893 [Eretmocerus hayati]|uniref:Uncharacterized protein n=1 Tax=Eretmocerus hayati TaxID=131215 RepID=A0ACC2NVJ8_9HYME|nr:hypothetical protein QAD02_010893 [Eretmocerus hayati]
MEHRTRMALLFVCDLCNKHVGAVKSSLSNGIQDHRLSINQVNQNRHQPAILKRKAIDDANSPVVVKVYTDESGEWEAVDETAQNFNETTDIFICQSCNAVFTEKRELDIHRTNNHPRLIIVPKEVANTDESDIVYYGDYHQVLSTGKFHCGHCPSILSSIGAVRKHFRRLHKGVTVYTANVTKLTAKLTTSKKIETEEVPEAKNEKEVIIVRNFLKDPSDNLLRPCPCCDFSTLKCNVFRNHVRINHPDVWLKLSGLRIINNPNDEVTPNNPPEDDHNDGEDDTMGYWEQYEEETNQRLADKESTTTTVGNAPIDKKEAKQFSCPHCSYVSYGRSGMATHLNRFHTSENKKKNAEVSQQPIIIPTWTGYACGYCSFVGCNISSVNRHSERKHSSLNIMMGEIPVTTFDCDACKFRCEGRVPMYNHQKIHLPEPNEQGTYTCMYCKLTLSTNDNVLRHISRKHMALQESSMEELVECDRCEFSSMNKRVMEWHKEQHDLPPEKAGQIYACDECNYFSYEKRQLNYHLKRKHRIAIVSDTTTKNVKKVVEPKPIKDLKTVVPKPKRKKITPPPPIKNFKCEFCSWATTSQVLLDFHIMRKHQPKKEYTCDHCGKAFSLKGDLKLHIRNKHMTQVSYICDVCGQLCKTRNGLHVHQLYAHLESEFKCHFCNKFMVSEGKLQDHIVYHHERAPYVCESCGRSYREAYKLKDHMRTHTGERPHACPVCNKSFGKRCGLRQHILTHSNERPYICDVCERPFSQKTGVITHRKKFHPEVVDPLPPMPREIVDRLISDVVDGKNTIAMIHEE